MNGLASSLILIPDPFHRADLSRVSADTSRTVSYHSREITMVWTALSTDNEPKLDAR